MKRFVITISGNPPTGIDAIEDTSDRYRKWAETVPDGPTVRDMHGDMVVLFQARDYRAAHRMEEKLRARADAEARKKSAQAICDVMDVL